MSSVRVRFKLTVLCDSDLLTLNSIPEFGFKSWVRKALRTYAVTGETIKTPLPAPPVELSLKSIYYSINFNKHRDEAIIEWLKLLQRRRRSAAIKSVLRCSITHPCLYEHFITLPVLPPKNPGNVHSGKKAVPVNSAAVKQAKALLPASPAQSSDDLSDDFDIFNTEFNDL